MAIQLLDTPGDPKFAPLAKVCRGAYMHMLGLPRRGHLTHTAHCTLTPTYQVFHGVANFCMLVFDATSVGSFEVSKREASAWRVSASPPPLTQLRRGVRPYLPIYSLPSCLTPSRASQAIEALRIEFLEANPQYDAGRLLVVANMARTIDRDLTRAQTLTQP